MGGCVTLPHGDALSDGQSASFVETSGDVFVPVAILWAQMKMDALRG